MAAQNSTPESSVYTGLRMVVSPAEALQRANELRAFIKECMVPDVDYGVIDNGGKPSLYQPGAQKLCELYGFAWEYSDLPSIENWETGFFFYRRRCVLTSRRGEGYIGDGRGSCNSRETKYAYRWMFDNELPLGTDISKLKQRTGNAKSTGRPYTQYRVANDEIFSVVNTLEKMACKRALVHAVIGGTRSAGIFTQDREDLPEGVYGEVDERRTWEDEPKADAPKGEPKKATSVYDDIAAAIEAAATLAELDATYEKLVLAKKLKKVSADQYAELGRLGKKKHGEISARERAAG